MKYAPLIALLALGGCADDVPENPTWFGEVQEIMAANCVRCHGVPSANGAPATFRLDRFVAGDGVDPENADLPDAFDMVDRIIARAVDYETDNVPQMPPDSYLSNEQKELLARWAEQGFPKGSRDNHSPQVERLAPADVPDSVDQELNVRFRSFDDDGDGLIVAVGYRLAGSSDSPVLLASGLTGGITELDLDMGQLASTQRFDIVAVLDDGFSDDPAENRSTAVLLGDLLVDHGDRGTAPSVVVDAPNNGTPLLGVSDIVWTATDPDPGDVLTIAIDLVSFDAAGNEVAVESIATGLANTPPFAWDTGDVVATDGNGAAIPYKIRVTASDTDNKNTRSDDSDATFTIDVPTGTTDLGWEADIKPLFLTYCSGCHSQPSITPPLDYFRLDKYDVADTEAPANGDIGAFEQRSLVYMRLVTLGNMPPGSEPQMPAADVAKVAEWIEAGAPFGGASVDEPPTFTWTTPNDTATTTTATADVTLEWTATDPEGMPLTGSIVMAEINGGNPMVVNCPATLSGTTEVVGAANIEDGSFVVTLPNTGKFCFAASVTDAGGQTVTAATAFGIKF